MVIATKIPIIETTTNSSTSVKALRTLPASIRKLSKIDSAERHIVTGDDTCRFARPISWEQSDSTTLRKCYHRVRIEWLFHSRVMQILTMRAFASRVLRNQTSEIATEA